MSNKSKKPSYPFGSSAAARSSPLNPSSSRGPLPPSASSSAGGRPYLPAATTSSTTNLLSPTSASNTRNVSSSSINTTNSPSVNSIAPSISDKFSLSADPSAWGTELTPGHAEPDDYLHNPDPRRDRKNDQGGTIFTARGIANLGFLLFLVVGLVTLFAGYPLISHFLSTKPTKLGGYNLGGINASGQVPEMSNHFALVDPDTPESALHFSSYKDNTQFDLIFSDEFTTPGRSFYEGDDPYWEGVDLNYWQTSDKEWYDPAALTTVGGNLEITLTKMQTHNLSYQGGHVSSWNKFCFTGGYIEVNVSLPGSPEYPGLWPAIWMMGNLGRAGYGASLEGMWPYSYEACDWGTLPNQTFNGQPAAALTGGDPYHGDVLSYLQGQRLSSCTCQGESHPGPQNSDGTWVARSAPELDIFEATVAHIDGVGVGQVSQSCQFAPFDEGYNWKNGTNDVKVYNDTVSELNEYRGGVYQMATSALSNTDQTAYQESGGGFAIYGVEYAPGPNGYITWINNGQPAWTLYPSAVGPDAAVNISSRVIPQEPLYIIMNLGISDAFGTISDQLVFPAKMLIDYVRVYQDPNKRNVGCSPADYPTEKYINEYIEAYTNPNYTTWSLPEDKGGFNQPFPKNRLVDQCT